MKKLIYSMLALLCVALAFTFTSCDDDPSPANHPGDGSKDNPYTVIEALNIARNRTWTSTTDYETTDEVYVKGKISRIDNYGTFTESGSYGYASFYISDDGSQDNEFYCFRVLYIGNKKYTSSQPDIKVGDDVIIYGKLMNYRNNTPETVAGAAYLYSLNGAVDRTPGTIDNPYTVTDARIITEDLNWASTTAYEKTANVYVKGKISRISYNGKFAESGSFSNATFYISDDGTETLEFYCFRINYFKNRSYRPGQKDIKVGDEVVIYGKLMNYRNNTPQTVEGEACLYSINGATDGGTGSGEDIIPSGYSGNGSKDKPYSASDALEVVKTLNWTSNTDYETTDNVYIKGKISRIATKGTFSEGGTYGNASFYISNDGTEKDEFFCYRILYFGNKAYKLGQADIRVGDDVVVYGKLMNYKCNTPETEPGKAYLYSLNGAMDGGAGGGESSVSFSTNSEAQTWATATDGTYGSGYGTTTQGLNINYYKHTSATNPVAPNANHVRIYKNSVLCIASTEGKKIKEIIIKCAPDAGATTYCLDMTGLEGCANAVHDSDAKTITWTGSTKKVVLLANNGQVRMESLIVTFE